MITKNDTAITKKTQKNIARHLVRKKKETAGHTRKNGREKGHTRTHKDKEKQLWK
jgi:hypothetical protein